MWKAIGQDLSCYHSKKKIDDNFFTKTIAHFILGHDTAMSHFEIFLVNGNSIHILNEWAFFLFIFVDFFLFRVSVILLNSDQTFC